MTTQESNKLIAEFMGLKSEKSYTTLWMPSDEINPLNDLIYSLMEDETWYVISLDFHKSWDWLNSLTGHLHRFING